jgi:RNA polymerase I-specific transcription initiation factor RRN6
MQTPDTDAHLDLYLVLYSQLTQLVQAFPCPFIADEQTESISIPDPLILDAPLLMDVPPNKHNSPVRFSSLVFREVAHSVTPLGRNFYNPNLTLIKLFWMDCDLAVHESTFKGPRGDPEEPDSFRESSILRLRKRYTPTAYVRPDDNFVVDDWDESVTQQAVAPGYKVSTASVDTGSDLQWTLDFSAIYDIATGKSEIPRIKQNMRQRPKPRTLDGLIASLQSEMETGSMKQSPSQTMTELSGKRLLTEGLDESADDVKRLVSALMPENPDPGAQCRYMLLSVQSSNEGYGIPAKLSEEADRNFLNVYDRIVDDWMSTLPRTIPVQTRLMKEKLIRGVAADLILSRLIRISTSLDGIILPQPADAEEGQVNEKAVAQNQHLHSSYFSSLSSSQIPASQSSMTNSRLFGSRRDPMPVQQSKYAVVPVLSGLSAFTTFKPPRPTPRNVANLLSHWSVGSNPQNYTWERIEDEETRRSSRPNTPRSRRKKRSQTRDQSLPPTPAVPMVRTWGSQPVAPPRINISSSQPTMDGMPMTQMERGIFGAREFKKPKKKKKRAAGF